MVFAFKTDVGANFYEEPPGLIVSHFYKKKNAFSYCYFAVIELCSMAAV